MKNCSVCKEIKEYSFFYKNKRSLDGFNYKCKKCCVDLVEKRRKYLMSLKEKKINITDDINYKKNYYLKNKDKRTQYNREYYRKNKEKILIKNETYRQKNKDILNNKANKRLLKRRKDCKITALKIRIRSLILKSIKGNGYSKKSKTNDILGCDFIFFKEYIESQFKKGMTWKNIHLDHIKPLHTAKTEKQVLELNHYTNFQPLFATDNLKKHTKLINKQLRLI